MPSSPKTSDLTIAFLRRGYSSTGGVEVYLKGLATGLREKGHRVVLLGTHSWPSEDWPGGEILRCRGRSLREYVREVWRHNESCPFDLIISVEKVPGCDVYRTDEGVHAAWMRERSIYLTFWDRWFQFLNPKHREKLQYEEKIFRANSTRRVISISNKITKDIISYYGYPEKQISLIYNGIPWGSSLLPVDRSKARRSLDIPQNDKIVLFVGTGWERKGLRYALSAVEMLAVRDSRIRLLVAGKGNERRYRSPVVRFLGPVTDMRGIYAAADLLIAPAIFEPFSLAALEGLASGLPVITSSLAGVSEVMISGLHGEVIGDPSDISALSSALAKWIQRSDDPIKMSETAAACSHLASQFTLERNLRETISVLEEVMAEK